MTKYLALATLLAFRSSATAQTPNTSLGHARTEFHFTVNLPYDRAFPLFGAWAEQQWAPDWQPQFVYPDPPEDKEGAVFRVRQGSHSSVWILTRFDRAAGRVGYAFVLNNVIACRIDIHVTRNTSDKTDVSVAYEWTALDPAANEHVEAMAQQHEHAGPEWERQINAYAAAHK